MQQQSSRCVTSCVGLGECQSANLAIDDAFSLVAGVVSSGSVQAKRGGQRGAAPALP